MISIPTWTSANKTAAVPLLLIMVASLAAGSHYYGDGSDSGPITGTDTGFGVPEFDSQKEIVTQFVAPFLLIALVFQIGLERALMFTMAEDRWAGMGRDPNYRRERKKIKKRSTILALVITGMLVPTKFFQFINDLVAVVFGGSIYIIVTVAGIAALYFFFKSLSGEVGGE